MIKKSAVCAASLIFLLSACSGGDDKEASTATQEDGVAVEKTDDSTSQAVSSDGEKTATTDGSGLPPVTTVLGGQGADPDNIYKGKIGKLDPNDALVDAVAEPPATEPGTFPLTGLKGDSPDRAAAVIKIDNGKPAQPHDGLNAADIVIEEEVEGGVTRFAAVFHSTSSIVGPVRSGRTTDIALASSFGTPLFLYSGANDITELYLRKQTNFQNRNVGTSSGYWRADDRKAPSNLFTDTAPHWASATGEAPPAHFAYGDSTSVGSEAKEFSIGYRSKPTWTWSGETWQRSQYGAPHTLVDGEQVAAENVVVIEAESVDTGMVDASGGAVPEFVYVGSGKATIFTQGKQIDGVWTKPSLTSVATFTTSEGDVIELTPGRTWIQLIDASSDLLQVTQ